MSKLASLLRWLAEWADVYDSARSDLPANLRASTGSALALGPDLPVVVRPGDGGEGHWHGSSGEILTVKPAEAVVISPSANEIPTVQPESVMEVIPPPRGTWEERGWSLRSEKPDVYEGFYQITDQKTGQALRYPGRIHVSRWGIAPYIADPPPELKQHPKRACFVGFIGPWIRMHWYRAAKNIDDAILYMEKVLDECINGRKSN